MKVKVIPSNQISKLLIILANKIKMKIILSNILILNIIKSHLSLLGWERLGLTTRSGHGKGDAILW